MRRTEVATTTCERRTSRRMFSILGMLGLVVGLLSMVAPATQAKVSGQNGRIVFARFDRGLDAIVAYTANPYGSREQRLFPGSVGGTTPPRWSPDGSEVAIFAADPDTGEETLSAIIVNPDTGASRQLPMPSELDAIGCTLWSPDGSRLACEGGSYEDPSLSGIYTVRSSDGGGLTRVTSNPGGDDVPGDYSPDGKRLLFYRVGPDGSEALYTVLVNGGGLRKITPTTLIGFELGSWSPQGDQIVFAARTDGYRRSLWIVNANGTGLRQVPIQPSCGGALSDPASRACHDPGWSPDGAKIVLDIFVAKTNDRHIYTVNANGTGLFQVTNHGAELLGEGDQFPDWGPHPLVP